MKRAKDLFGEELRVYVTRLNGRFQWMRSFMNMAPMPALMKDSNGRVLYVNRAAEKLFGRRSEEMFGKRTESFSGDGPARVEEQDLQVLTARSSRVFTNVVQRPNGKRVRYSVLKFVFEDEFGEAYIGLIGIEHNLASRGGFIRKMLGKQL